MKENRQYLVMHRMGDIFALTPHEIDNNNDSGACLRLLKIDEKGRVYVDPEVVSFGELFTDEVENV